MLFESHKQLTYLFTYWTTQKKPSKWYGSTETYLIPYKFTPNTYETLGHLQGKVYLLFFTFSFRRTKSIFSYLSFRSLSETK